MKQLINDKLLNRQSMNNLSLYLVRSCVVHEHHVVLAGHLLEAVLRLPHVPRLVLHQRSCQQTYSRVKEFGEEKSKKEKKRNKGIKKRKEKRGKEKEKREEKIGQRVERKNLRAHSYYRAGKGEKEKWTAKRNGNRWERTRKGAKGRNQI